MRRKGILNDFLSADSYLFEMREKFKLFETGAKLTLGTSLRSLQNSSHFAEMAKQIKFVLLKA